MRGDLQSFWVDRPEVSLGVRVVCITTWVERSGCCRTQTREHGPNEGPISITPDQTNTPQALVLPLAPSLQLHLAVPQALVLPLARQNPESPVALCHRWDRLV
jgi:hypothetical protein